MKKSVFDIIRPRLTGARFLDVYAGTGSVGLEALSRGASYAAFLERDPRNASLIRQNLAQLGMEGEGGVFTLSATGDLSLLPKPFDIVFMGPPYKDDEKKPLALVLPTLEQVERFALLKDGGFIIAQHHRKEIVPDTAGPWRKYRSETYGDTVVSFLDRRP